MQYVRYAVEGPSDEPVAEKMLRSAGLEPYRTLTAHGKGNLDKKLPGLNKTASSMAWLVIRDMDRDDSHLCIPELHSKLLDGDARAGMCFRLAVRATEAWLLADHDAFADYFGVRRRLPSRVDQLNDPKQFLIDLCRRSKRKDIREGIPPRPGGGRTVGPEYVAIVRDYGLGCWNPDRARNRSPSLERALECLAGLRTWLESRHSSAGRSRR